MKVGVCCVVLSSSADVPVANELDTSSFVSDDSSIGRLQIRGLSDPEPFSRPSAIYMHKDVVHFSNGCFPPARSTLCQQDEIGTWALYLLCGYHLWESTTRQDLCPGLIFTSRYAFVTGQWTVSLQRVATGSYTRNFLTRIFCVRLFISAHSRWLIATL